MNECESEIVKCMLVQLFFFVLVVVGYFLGQCNDGYGRSFGFIDVFGMKRFDGDTMLWWC